VIPMSYTSTPRFDEAAEVSRGCCPHGGCHLPVPLDQGTAGRTTERQTKTPAGRFFFHVMASLAQMERELIMEHTRAGLAAAKKRGRTGGRKRRMTESKNKSGKTLLESGASPLEVARNLGVSIPTLYRWLPTPARA
jgi:DNA invertase Pin-like site-specific DNA recombinase